MRIGLIGFGGVGSAFIDLLAEKKEGLEKENIKLEVIYVLNSRGGIYKEKGVDCKDLVNFISEQKDIQQYSGWDKNINYNFMIKRKDIDLIIELTPTQRKSAETALSFIKGALENGVHVVTGNKGPIAKEYSLLKKLAAYNKVYLGIGCTCGGALPAINGGIIEMAGSSVHSIEGILNGTTNFIMQEMEKSGCAYTTALKKAQELGIAETDPTLDVEGWDTALKLLILTNAIMGEEKTLKDVEVRGITNIKIEEVQTALKEEKKFKLIGKTNFDGEQIKMTVGLEKIGADHPFYNVEGKNKGVRYISDTLGELVLIGGASGTKAAAASILRDIILIHNKIFPKYGQL